MNSLAEDLLLASIDPRNGVLRCGSEISFGLAGAELVMLAAAGRIQVGGDGRLSVVEPVTLATGDKDLDATLSRLAAGRPLKVRAWVGRASRKLASRYLDRLVAAGAVQRRGGGLWPRYPVTDQARAAELRTRLDAIVLGQGPANDRDAAFAALADAIGLAWILYRGRENRDARKRLRQITKNHWAAEPVRRVAAAREAASAG